MKNHHCLEFSQAHQTNHNKYLEAGTYRDDGGYPVLVSYLIGEFETILGMNDKGRRRKPKPYIKHYLNNHGQVPIWVLMNYLSLGQTVKFFNFQESEIRRSIASTFTDLYRHEHSIPRNIRPKTLSRAFDHIKDMRNICVHDERLYCARVSPRNDTTFANVLDDLSLVLPASKSEEMRLQVLTELASLSNDLETISIIHILKKMGFESIDSLIQAA
ncbi:MAG: Abi family protein [Coriobacteriia bacterium]|nr:Abi family protein [Coriobacteriia bacterium]